MSNTVPSRTCHLVELCRKRQCRWRFHQGPELRRDVARPRPQSYAGRSLCPSCRTCTPLPDHTIRSVLERVSDLVVSTSERMALPAPLSEGSQSRRALTSESSPRLKN